MRVEKRGRRWRARVFPGGGRERSQTFDRKVDAERWAVTQEADVARGQWVDPALGRISFADWVERWEPTLVDLRPSTRDLNRRVVRVHLLPRFGRMPLDRIANVDVKAMIADDMVAGYSSSAVRRHVFVLRSILRAAVEDGRLGRNVADGVRLPTEQARRMRFLTAEQLTSLAGAVPSHYRPLVLTAGWVGLRWGELAGLRLAKVDLLRGKITVDEQLTEVGAELSFGPPKTRAGSRVVTIPKTLTDVLGAHFATEPVQTSHMAFPTVTGCLMRRRGFYAPWRAAVRHVFADTDLEGLTFHELRHTAAALAIAHGAHPQTIKERLGHASITTTMDTYGGLFPSADEALAEALDTSISKALLASDWPERGDVTRLRRSEG